MATDVTERSPVITIGNWCDGLDDGTDAAPITPRRVLGYAPVYQAVSKISGGIAKLPLGSYRRLRDGKEIDRRHPSFRLINLLGKANARVSSFKLWRRMMSMALLWNNGWVWIERDIAGRPIGLYNLLSDRTTYGESTRNRGEMVVYTEVDGRLWELPIDDVMHIEGVSIDGQQGEDFVRLFREDFRAGLSARGFLSKFFDGGGNLGGILMVPEGAKPESVRKVEKSIEKKFEPNSSSRFKTLVLRDGFRWQATQVDPKSASVQSIDENQTRHVAQMFNIDPSELGVRGSTSYNSREMARADFHDNTLTPWLVAIKSEANLKLLSAEEIASDTHFIDYNINALMWTDAKTRAEIANKGIITGRFSPNETRAWDNLNPYDGGNVFWQQLNLQQVSRDADDEYEGEPDNDPQTDDTPDDSRALHRRLLVETMTRMHGRLHGQAKKHHDWRSIWSANESACREILSTPAAVAGVSVDAMVSAYAASKSNSRNDDWDNVRAMIPHLCDGLLAATDKRPKRRRTHRGVRGKSQTRI